MKHSIYRPILWAAAAGLALSSCGIYSHYQPATEAPADLFGRDFAADSTSFAALPWREVFTDPYLQALVDQGLEGNLDYRQAELRIREAEASLLSSRLSYLPSFALAPQGSVASVGGSKASWTYEVPLTASWELDIFGKMRNAKRQAQALYAQSVDYRQAVRTQLIAGIANAYYTLLMLDEQLAIALQTQTLWRQQADATRALMQAGRANEAACAQMEAACAEVATSVLTLQEQQNQVENSLSLLLGQTPHPIERGTWQDQTFPEHLSVGVPLQLLSNRPDVRSAERSLERAFYATAQARSSFYPSVTLGGSAGWTNSVGGAIVNPAKFLASALASLTQPLFARGQLTAQLKVAKAQEEEARLAFQQTLLNAGVEVNEAMTQYQTARAKAAFYTKQVASLQSAYRSTSLLMEHGTTTYLEVLTAQNSLLSAQLTQASNRLAEVQGLISLYRALGGGED